jgi:hypothetical protein
MRNATVAREFEQTTRAYVHARVRAIERKKRLISTPKLAPDGCSVASFRGHRLVVRTSRNRIASAPFL